MVAVFPWSPVPAAGCNLFRRTSKNQEDARRPATRIVMRIASSLLVLLRRGRGLNPAAFLVLSMVATWPASAASEVVATDDASVGLGSRAINGMENFTANPPAYFIEPSLV